MKPAREAECVLTLRTRDDVISIPSKARISVAHGSAPGEIKLAFVSELFALVVSMDEIKLTLRAIGSTRLPIERLGQLATLLSWAEEELRIEATGDAVPETTIPAVRIAQSPALDRSVLAAIRTLGIAAGRSQATEVTLSLDEVMSAHAELMVYCGVLTADRVGLSTESIGPSFDHEALCNLGYIDLQVVAHTFLTLFDAPTETRVDERGNLVVELGRRNVRDCVVGRRAGDGTRKGAGCVRTVRWWVW